MTINPNSVKFKFIKDHKNTMTTKKKRKNRETKARIDGRSNLSIVGLTQQNGDNLSINEDISAPDDSIQKENN